MTSIHWKDIGFHAPPHKTRVVVAMSGGVDSSVTAALMKEEGFDVIGVTLQLYDQGITIGKKNSCCAGQDIYDAAQVAEKMDFPHYILDYESIFKKAVIEDFADSYMRGETPVPCIQCNQKVKFKDLLKTAQDLGADALVTGHYVQRKTVRGKAELHQALDLQKDQSYFLFTTTQEELDFLRFPLGALTKKEARAHAKRFGLSIAEKPDSQDICFVPNGNYADIVSKLRPEATKPGHIVHIDGSTLGQHQGVIHYTIGQRKRLGIGGRVNDTAPLYVVRLDSENAQVIVGPKEALKKTTMRLKNVNWLGHSDNNNIKTCQIKIRSTSTAMDAILDLKSGIATLRKPEHGVAAGQACVFYEGSRVLGGGWITSV